MRFYKVLAEKVYIGLGQYLFEGDVFYLSYYYNGIVVVATPTVRTRFTFYSNRHVKELFLSGDIEKLTPQELNKIRPHLTKKMLEHGLD